MSAINRAAVFVVVGLCVVLFSVAPAYASKDSADLMCAPETGNCEYGAYCDYPKNTIKGVVDKYCEDVTNGIVAAKGHCTAWHKCLATSCGSGECKTTDVKVDESKNKAVGNEPPAKTYPLIAPEDGRDVKSPVQPPPSKTNESLLQRMLDPTPFSEQKTELSPSANSVGELLKQIDANPGLSGTTQEQKQIGDLLSPTPLNPNQESFQLQPRDKEGNLIPQDVGPQNTITPNSTFGENQGTERPQVSACDSWWSCLQERVSSAYGEPLEEAALKTTRTPFSALVPDGKGGYYLPSDIRLSEAQGPPARADADKVIGLDGPAQFKATYYSAQGTGSGEKFNGSGFASSLYPIGTTGTMEFLDKNGDVVATRQMYVNDWGNLGPGVGADLPRQTVADVQAETGVKYVRDGVFDVRFTPEAVIQGKLAGDGWYADTAAAKAANAYVQARTDGALPSEALAAVQQNASAYAVYQPIDNSAPPPISVASNEAVPLPQNNPFRASPDFASVTNPELPSGAAIAQQFLNSPDTRSLALTGEPAIAPPQFSAVEPSPPSAIADVQYDVTKDPFISGLDWSTAAYSDAQYDPTQDAALASIDWNSYVTSDAQYDPTADPALANLDWVGSDAQYTPTNADIVSAFGDGFYGPKTQAEVQAAIDQAAPYDLYGESKGSYTAAEEGFKKYNNEQADIAVNAINWDSYVTSDAQYDPTQDATLAIEPPAGQQQLDPDVAKSVADLNPSTPRFTEAEIKNQIYKSFAPDQYEKLTPQSQQTVRDIAISSLEFSQRSAQLAEERRQSIAEQPAQVTPAPSALTTLSNAASTVADLGKSAWNWGSEKISSWFGGPSEPQKSVVAEVTADESQRAAIPNYQSTAGEYITEADIPYIIKDTQTIADSRSIVPQETEAGLPSAEIRAAEAAQLEARRAQADLDKAEYEQRVQIEKIDTVDVPYETPSASKPDEPVVVTKEAAQRLADAEALRATARENANELTTQEQDAQAKAQEAQRIADEKKKELEALKSDISDETKNIRAGVAAALAGQKAADKAAADWDRDKAVSSANAALNRVDGVIRDARDLLKDENLSASERAAIQNNINIISENRAAMAAALAKEDPAGLALVAPTASAANKIAAIGENAAARIDNGYRAALADALDLQKQATSIGWDAHDARMTAIRADQYVKNIQEEAPQAVATTLPKSEWEPQVVTRAAASPPEFSAVQPTGEVPIGEVAVAPVTPAPAGQASNAPTGEELRKIGTVFDQTIADAKSTLATAQAAALVTKDILGDGAAADFVKDVGVKSAQSRLDEVQARYEEYVKYMNEGGKAPAWMQNAVEVARLGESPLSRELGDFKNGTHEAADEASKDFKKELKPDGSAWNMLTSGARWLGWTTVSTLTGGVQVGGEMLGVRGFNPDEERAYKQAIDPTGQAVGATFDVAVTTLPFASPVSRLTAWTDRGVTAIVDTVAGSAARSGAEAADLLTTSGARVVTREAAEIPVIAEQAAPRAVADVVVAPSRDAGEIGLKAVEKELAVTRSAPPPVETQIQKIDQIAAEARVAVERPPVVSSQAPAAGSKTGEINELVADIRTASQNPPINLGELSAPGPVFGVKPALSVEERFAKALADIGRPPRTSEASTFAPDTVATEARLPGVRIQQWADDFVAPSRVANDNIPLIDAQAARLATESAAGVSTEAERIAAATAQQAPRGITNEGLQNFERGLGQAVDDINAAARVEPNAGVKALNDVSAEIKAGLPANTNPGVRALEDVAKDIKAGLPNEPTPIDSLKQIPKSGTTFDASTGQQSYYSQFKDRVTLAWNDLKTSLSDARDGLFGRASAEPATENVAPVYDSVANRWRDPATGRFVSAPEPVAPEVRVVRAEPVESPTLPTERPTPIDTTSRNPLDVLGDEARVVERSVPVVRPTEPVVNVPVAPNVVEATEKPWYQRAYESVFGKSEPAPVVERPAPVDTTKRNPLDVLGDEGPVSVAKEKTFIPDSVNRDPIAVLGDEGPVVEKAIAGVQKPTGPRITATENPTLGEVSAGFKSPWATSEPFFKPFSEWSVGEIKGGKWIVGGGIGALGVYGFGITHLPTPPDRDVTTPETPGGEQPPVVPVVPDEKEKKSGPPVRTGQPCGPNDTYASSGCYPPYQPISYNGNTPNGPVLDRDYYCITSITPVVVVPVSAGTPFPTGSCYNNPGTSNGGSSFGNVLGQALGKMFGTSSQAPAPTTNPNPTKPTTDTPTTTPVVLKPFATLISEPTTVQLGKKSRLIWSSVNTISCELFAPDNFLVATGTRGSTSTLALATTTLFRLECSAQSGATTSAQATVRIQ